MKFLNWVRCKINAPAVYRDYRGDGSWWISKCKSCKRQVEIAHENRWR